MDTHSVGHLASALAFGGITVAILRGRRTILRNFRKGLNVYRTVLILGSTFSFLNLLFLLESWLIGQHAVFTPLSTLLHYLGIFVLAGLGVVLLQSKIIVERTSKPKRILALGAHPDDLELACGATLAKMRDAGHVVYGLVLTQGEQGGDARVRGKEATGGGEFLGFDMLEVKSFKDTALATQSNEICQTIERIVKQFKPDIILTHSAHDQHQDHTAVHEATLRAARNHSTILCYESPSVTRAFSPTIFVDVTNYLDVKIESIKYHNDQKSKRYVHDEHVRGVASFRGGQAKTRYAEGFESVRTLSASLGDI